jgi:thioredoxin-like negative regulator of GroEL
MTHEREHQDVRHGWFTEILSSALNDLAHAERVITAYAAQEPDGFIAWGMAEGEAVQAHQALRQAPSLHTATPTDYTTVNATADALYELARKISQSLVRAAELASDPDDKMACLQAALHAGRLQETLR